MKILRYRGGVLISEEEYIPGHGRGPINQGAILWKELHEWAKTGEGGEAWFAAWNEKVKLLPGCSCSKHWSEVLKKLPVCYSDLYQWSVKAHNEVNKILGKPLFHVEQILDKSNQKP